MKKLEFVRDVQEGLGNVTNAYFLFPYAFIGSRAQLDYIIKTNYTDDKLGRRSALHISDQCFALFGVSIALREESVYRSRFNDGILMLQQSGLIEKIKNDVRWDMIRSSKGGLLTVYSGKVLKMPSTEEKGLTLADTEGMFLLLGIGFLIAAGVLVSEWVGGCTNKCIRIVRVRREQKKEEHRVEEEERREADVLAQRALESVSTVLGIGLDETHHQIQSESQKSSRSSSISVQELSPAMLSEMYNGPQRKHANIIMIDGKMMNEFEALQYANDFKEEEETIDQNFKFLISEKSSSTEFSEIDDEESKNSEDLVDLSDVNEEMTAAPPVTSSRHARSQSFSEAPEPNRRPSTSHERKNLVDDDFNTTSLKNRLVTQVEINLQTSAPKKNETQNLNKVEAFFGEKIDDLNLNSKENAKSQHNHDNQNESNIENYSNSEIQSQSARKRAKNTIKSKKF